MKAGADKAIDRWQRIVIRLEERLAMQGENVPQVAPPDSPTHARYHDQHCEMP